MTAQRAPSRRSPSWMTSAPGPPKRPPRRQPHPTHGRRPGDSPAPVASTEESRALKDSIARITADVAALKAAVDTSGRSANSQLVKLGDRLDRFERAQAEPAAKLAKLAEAIDRIERRTPGPNAAAAVHDTTGAIAAVAPSPQPQAVAVRDAGPPVLEGWVVRSVYN